MSDKQKSNETVAQDWFSREVAWFMRSYDPCYPASGESSNERDGDTYSLVFRGSKAHEEGGESIELRATIYADGVCTLKESKYMQDCDGPLDHHWEAVVVDGKIERGDSWQRDHFAEQAGY